jgi:transcriptional regulator with XRE-family HTH domain
MVCNMKIDLYAAIAAKNMSKVECARAVGVHQSQITRWNQSQSVPPERIVDLSRVLGVPATDLMSPELETLIAAINGASPAR